MAKLVEGSTARQPLHTRLAVCMVGSALAALFIVALVVCVTYLTTSHGKGDSSGSLLLAMLVAIPLALGVATGLALRLSRQLLAPLAQVIARTRQIASADIDQRLVLPEQRDELYDLTVELNALL